jgi:hypothetical protein
MACGGQDLGLEVERLIFSVGDKHLHDVNILCG